MFNKENIKKIINLMSENLEPDDELVYRNNYKETDEHNKNLTIEIFLNTLNNDEGLNLIVKEHDKNKGVFLEFEIIHSPFANFVLKNIQNETICHLYFSSKLQSSILCKGKNLKGLMYCIGKLIYKAPDENIFERVSVFNNNFQNYDFRKISHTFSILNRFNRDLNLIDSQIHFKKLTLTELKDIIPLYNTDASSYELKSMNNILILVPGLFEDDVTLPVIDRETESEYIFKTYQGYFKSFNINEHIAMTNYIDFIVKMKEEIDKHKETGLKNVETSILFRESIIPGKELIDLKDKYRDHRPQIVMNFKHKNKNIFLEIKINPDDVYKNIYELPISFCYKPANHIENILGEQLTLNKLFHNQGYYFDMIVLFDFQLLAAF